MGYAAIFGFSTSHLFIAIFRTIKTNPGNFHEEKEWDFSTTDSSAAESGDENSNLILTDDDENSSNSKPEGVQEHNFEIFTNEMIEMQIRMPQETSHEYLQYLRTVEGTVVTQQ